MPRSELTGAERHVLGAMMRSGLAPTDELARVRPADFSADAHQVLAGIVCGMWAEREPVDLTTVAARATTAGLLKRLGTDDNHALEWLTGIWDDAPTADGARFFLRELREAAKTRALAVLAGELVRRCDDPDGPADEMIGSAVARLMAMADSGRGESRLRSSADVTNAALDAIDRRARGEKATGIKFGLDDVDVMTGGIPAPGMTILAARPSVGKTALALQASRFAAANGHSVLFVSLEQDAEELGTRALAAEARVCGQTLRLGRRLEPAEQRSVQVAANRLRSIRLDYDDTPGATGLQIAAAARKVKRAGGLDLLVVDYLQLVAPHDQRATRNDQLDLIARQIRETARELGCAALTLSQLSRASEQQNRRPRLSDLRDSGALEQHADAVMILHRPERSEGDVDAVELSIEKQRNGPTGLVNLSYRKRTLTFEGRGLSL